MRHRGDVFVLGSSAKGHTAHNLRERPELVLNFPAPELWQAWSPLVYDFRHYFGLGPRLGKARRAEY